MVLLLVEVEATFVALVAVVAEVAEVAEVAFPAKDAAVKAPVEGLK